MKANLEFDQKVAAVAVYFLLCEYQLNLVYYGLVICQIAIANFIV